jgi:hypothetical protein
MEIDIVVVVSAIDFPTTMYYLLKMY